MKITTYKTQKNGKNKNNHTLQRVFKRQKNN